MKQYQKPRLVALSLSANDMLCGGCTAQTRFDSGLSSIFENAFPGSVNADGFFTKEEADEIGLFASSADTCSTEAGNMFQYCKFSAADNGYMTIFTS